MALITRTKGQDVPQVYAVTRTSKNGYRVLDTRTGSFWGAPGEHSKRNAEMNANACNLGFLRDRVCTAAVGLQTLCGGTVPAGVGSVCERAHEHLVTS